MSETYTYTARNAKQPSKVITFTLEDSHMRVNLTGFLDQVGQISGADDKTEETRRQFNMQFSPATLKIIEGLSGPLHVSDVSAEMQDGNHLRLKAWQRAGGLRLAPVNIDMGEIDNPDAAEIFLEELEARKKNANSIRKFAGPLDYWLGWAALLAGVAALLLWPRRRHNA